MASKRLDLILIIVMLVLVTASACRRDAPEAREGAPAPIPAERSTAVAPVVSIEMQDVHYRAAEHIVLNVEWLQGQLISKNRGKAPVFDDQQSFRLDIKNAEISLGTSSLTALVNAAFDYADAPLSDLSVSIEEGQLEQKGTLHKGIAVPFKVKAQVATTPNGRMRLHPTSVSTVGIPLKGLMSALDIELEELIKTRSDRGVQVQQNDLLLEPGRMLPGLEMRGALTRVSVENNMLVQTYGDGRRARPKKAARGEHYIWFRGGTITFGKLTMVDADLQLIDADPRDPFDFFAAKYNDQLVAGYSRNTPSLGLKTYMPDFGDLKTLPHGRLPGPQHLAGD